MENLKPQAGGYIFSLGERGYRAGTTTFQNVNVPFLKPNERSGIGNYTIVRTNSFETPEMKTRAEIIDFEKLQAYDIETNGQKIQLSSQTIEELFKFKIPDPTDIFWLAEETRLKGVYRARGMTDTQIKQELDVNKPLGREQRETLSKGNLGHSILSTFGKLDEIKQEIAQGRAETKAEQRVLLNQMATTFNKVDELKTLTEKEFIDITTTLGAIEAPKTHKELGIIPRFIDWKYYSQNEGILNMLILGNVRTDKGGINFKEPVYSYVSDIKGEPIQLSVLIRQMNLTYETDKTKKDFGENKRKFFDCHRRGIISFTQLKAYADDNLTYPNGFNDKAFDIFPGYTYAMKP